MEQARLTDLLARIQGLRIAVLGDLFLDAWMDIDPALDEPSLETGKIAFQVVGSRYRAGAAGTVLGNLCALGAKCQVISYLGEDGNGWQVRQALSELGVDCGHVLSVAGRMTPTYLKPMFQRGGTAPDEGNRFDFKNHSTTPGAVEDALEAAVWQVAPEVDALLVLDQLTEADTGVVTRRMREVLAEVAKKHPELLIFVDSRAFIHEFQGLTTKCNWLEATRQRAEDAPPFVQAEVEQAFRGLQERAKQVFVTCSENGILFEEAGDLHLMPIVRQAGPVDPCGAGDACSAGLVTALCAGATAREAALFGNLTAGVVVRKLGTTGAASAMEVETLFAQQMGAEP